LDSTAAPHTKITIDPPRQPDLRVDPHPFHSKLKAASDNGAVRDAVTKFSERFAIEAIELLSERAARTLNGRSCVEYPIQRNAGAHERVRRRRAEPVDERKWQFPSSDRAGGNCGERSALKKKIGSDCGAATQIEVYGWSEGVSFRGDLPARIHPEQIGHWHGRANAEREHLCQQSWRDKQQGSHSHLLISIRAVHASADLGPPRGRTLSGNSLSVLASAAERIFGTPSWSAILLHNGNRARAAMMIGSTTRSISDQASAELPASQ
jgi:hypothetical protein